jgi:uncharacterized protein (TIGR02266 family)
MSEQPKDKVVPSESDRRDSPRVPMRFLVRRAGETGDFEARQGDLSIGGFAWHGSAWEAGARVEVRFILPGAADELQARGEVVRVDSGPQGPISRVRFVELPVEVEMRIARYLDELARPGGSV